PNFRFFRASAAGWRPIIASTFVYLCLSKSHWQTGLGGFAVRLWRRAHLLIALSVNIVASVGLDVCDGAHWLGVMKKVKGPAQAKLGRGTHQR
ncbi:MAG: hypothetical protein WA383_19785, partial [Terriglobales bacterium]